MRLSEAQIRRYSRHILLPDVGGTGQRRLLEAAVAIEVGPGRAAEVAALAYLAAAGVGRLVLGGDPRGPVSAGEAAAGIVYGHRDVGRPRIDALRERLVALNPDVTVVEDSLEPPRALPLAPVEVDLVGPGAGGEDEVAAALLAGGAAALATVHRIAAG